jgi:hypothetical protein
MQKMWLGPNPKPQTLNTCSQGMLKYHFANLFAKVDSGNRISPTDLHCIDWRRAFREVSRKEALLKLVRVWSGQESPFMRVKGDAGEGGKSDREFDQSVSNNPKGGPNRESSDMVSARNPSMSGNGHANYINEAFRKSSAKFGRRRGRHDNAGSGLKTRISVFFPDVSGWECSQKDKSLYYVRLSWPGTSDRAQHHMQREIQVTRNS